MTHVFIITKIDNENQWKFTVNLSVEAAVYCHCSISSTAAHDGEIFSETGTASMPALSDG